MSNRTCMAVMYHYVRDSAATAFPHIRALSPAMFGQQLDWLQANYTVLDLPVLEEALRSGGDLPPNAAVLTFDDGFIDHYAAVFPELRRRGMSGVFFLSHVACTEPPRLLSVHQTQFLLAHLGAEAFGRAVLAECRVEHSMPAAGRTVFGADRWEAADERAVKNLLNYELPFDEAQRILDALFVRHIGDPAAFAREVYLTRAQVAEMARGGMTFGYHTRTHRMLSRLDADQQARELDAGPAWIREMTGQATVPFCYPWGGRQTYTAETVALLDRLGYSLAFNTVRRRLVAGVDSRFELPRLDTRDLPPYTSGERDALAAAHTGEDA